MNDKPKQVPWKAGEAADDRFTNELAQNYLGDRQAKKDWRAENDAVEMIFRHSQDGSKFLDVFFGTRRFAPIY